MKYTRIKAKLLSMFGSSKLKAAPKEWGFFNEIKEEIRCISTHRRRGRAI